MRVNEGENSITDQKLLTISHDALECPTGKEYEQACQDFCAYARQHLTPYVWRTRSEDGGRGQSINYQSEVMQIMGCLSFV